MIERRRDYEKKKPYKNAHKIYIVCEGSLNEPNYFEFFRGLSSNLEIIPIPSKDGKTDPVKLMERAKSIFVENDHCFELDYSQGDTVWFVIDTDTWKEEGKIDTLRSFCEKINRYIPWLEIKTTQYPAWRVAQSNPCFEIWLYYHSYNTKPIEKDVSDCVSFKEYVNKAYNGGFDYEYDPINLPKAIKNSELNFEMQEGGVGVYSTEMHLLGDEILGFVNQDLRRLQNKLQKIR